MNKLDNFQSSNCTGNVLQNCILMQDTELLSALPTRGKEPRFIPSSYPPPPEDGIVFIIIFHMQSLHMREFFNKGEAHSLSGAVENVPYHQVLDILHRCVSMSL